MKDKKIDRLAHQIAESVLRAEGIACLVVHERCGAAALPATRITAHLIGDDLRNVGEVYWFGKHSAAKAVLREMCKTTRTIADKTDVNTYRVHGRDTAVNVFAADVGLLVREAAARIGVELIDQRDIEARLEATAARLQPTLTGLARKRGALTVQRRLWRAERAAGQPFAEWFAKRIGEIAKL